MDKPELARFDAWLAGCRELPPGHADIPQTIAELGVTEYLTVYLFPDGGWFVEISANSYWTHVVRSEKESGSFGVMAEWLWQNWSSSEWAEGSSL